LICSQLWLVLQPIFVDQALAKFNQLQPCFCAGAVVFAEEMDRLGVIREAGFDVKAASASLKLLIERFLRPQAIAIAKQVRLPKREENGRRYRSERHGD
jgi:hypothetical protein